MADWRTAKPPESLRQPCQGQWPQPYSSDGTTDSRRDPRALPAPATGRAPVPASINTTYNILFDTPRDRTTINYLSRQAFLGNNTLIQVYKDYVQSEPYRYLVLDFNVFTPDRFRIWTGILNSERAICFDSYVKRKFNKETKKEDIITVPPYHFGNIQQISLRLNLPLDLVGKYVISKQNKLPPKKVIKRQNVSKLSTDDQAVLTKLYNSISFSSVRKFAITAKLPEVLVKQWLHKQRNYTLFKPKRVRFPRQKIIVYGVDATHQYDLLDVSRWSEYNKGTTFLCNVIDVFSKFASCEPIKSKSGLAVKNALIKIYKTRPFPKKVHSDQGKEYYNTHIKAYFKQNNIEHYSTRSEIKGSNVERFNKTIQGMIYKQIYKSNVHEYVSILPELVNEYNNTIHSAHSHKPSEVNNDNAEAVWHQLYERGKPLPRIQKYKLNDYVRIQRAVTKFRKGFRPNFTEEIFKIYKIKKAIPVSYYLKDLYKERIEGSFYNDELVHIHSFNEKDAVYLVDEVIESRKKNKKLEHLVKYFDLPAKFNEWLPANQLQAL